MPTVWIVLFDALLIGAGIEASGRILEATLYPSIAFGFEATTVASLAGLISGIVSAYLTGLHQTSVMLEPRQVVLRSLVTSAATALGVLLASHFVWYLPMGRTAWATVGLLSFIDIVGWRTIYAGFVERGPRIPLVVLGTGVAQRRFATQINGVRHTRYKVVGYADARSAPSRELVEADSGELPIWSDLNQLVDDCRDMGVNTVVVVGSETVDESKRRALSAARVAGMHIKTAERMVMEVCSRVPTELVDDRWFINSFEQFDTARDRLKRVIDVTLSLIGLLGFALLLPALYMLVRLECPGPFFFSQVRVGLGNREFRIYKVRMMRNDSTKQQRWAERNDARTTRIGGLLAT